MKKIIFVLLALLMLCSCTNSNNMYSQISEDEVLFSGPDNYSYSKSQLYKAMKADAGESIVYDILKRIALENNLVNLEELEKQADEFAAGYIGFRAAADGLEQLKQKSAAKYGKGEYDPDEVALSIRELELRIRHLRQLESSE